MDRELCRVGLLNLVAALLLAGCEEDPNNKCPQGYVWEPNTQQCVPASGGCNPPCQQPMVCNMTTGQCENPATCPVLCGMNSTCVSTMCVCNPGFFDCNFNLNLTGGDGCECNQPCNICGGIKQDAGPKPDTTPQPVKVCISYCDNVSDCAQGAKACVNKKCVFCQSNLDCQPWGGAMKCDTSSGICIMCESDMHCFSMGQPIWSGKCDTSLKLCVKCASPQDCNWQNSTTKICKNNQCVQCQSDGDCASQPVKGCDQYGFCAKCKSDAECCPPTKPGCALKCNLAKGWCTCQTNNECQNAATEGKWECRVPPT